MVSSSIGQQLQDGLSNMKLDNDIFAEDGVFNSPWLDDLDSSFKPPHPLDQSSSSDKFGLNRFGHFWFLRNANCQLVDVDLCNCNMFNSVRFCHNFVCHLVGAHSEENPGVSSNIV